MTHVLALEQCPYEAMVAIVLADQALQHIAISRNLKNEKK